MTNNTNYLRQQYRGFLCAGMSTLLWLFLSAQFVRAQTNTFPASGNVGIGTTNPQFTLDVKGYVTSYVLGTLNPNNIQATFWIGWQNNVARLRIGGNGVGATNGFDIQFTGDRSVMRILHNGNIGIGTSNPKAKLAVEGNILAKEVKVKTDISVPDYVFEPDYALPALTEIEAYVKEHKHLPEIPSAKDIERDGLDLAEMNLLLLKKVEELTLHLIEKEKAEHLQNERIARLERQLRNR